MTSLSLSINARGATVPLSTGFLLIYRNNERNAESKVGGDVGMERAILLVFGEEVEGACAKAGVCVSLMEDLRSYLRRMIGVEGMDEGGRGEERNGGEGDSGTSETEGSGCCMTRSRNGPQKYSACRTELA